VAFCSTFWHLKPLCATPNKNATDQSHAVQGFEAFFDTKSGIFDERLFDSFFVAKEKGLESLPKQSFQTFGNKCFALIVTFLFLKQNDNFRF